VIGEQDFCTSCGAAVSETEVYKKLCKVLRRIIDEMSAEMQKSWSGRRRLKKTMAAHGNVAADGPPEVMAEQLDRLYFALLDVMGEMVQGEVIGDYVSSNAQSMWDVMTDSMMEQWRSSIALRFQLSSKETVLRNLQTSIAAAKDFVDRSGGDWMKPAFKKFMRWAEQESERIRALPYD
jgi:hypothetical protein